MLEVGAPSNGSVGADAVNGLVPANVAVAVPVNAVLAVYAVVMCCPYDLLPYENETAWK